MSRSFGSINAIVVHCSDSSRPEHDSIDVIREWHIARGFNDIGYHYVISTNGDVHEGRRLDEVGAHVKGHNSNTIGICLTGRNNFSHAQLYSLGKLHAELETKLNKKLSIYPHNKFDKGKTCPNFSIPQFS